MNTHTKGQLAELKVQQRAVEKGYLVSKPIYDGGRYDLIIDDGQKLWRVQVKYADGGASHCEGAVTVGLEKRRKDGNLLYTSDEIDMLKTITGKYQDFSRTKEQKTLFGD